MLRTLLPTPKMGSKNYFRLEVSVLKMCGVSLMGSDSTAYKIYSLLMLTCFNFAYPFLASGDLFKHDFDDVARVFIYVVGTLMGAITTLAVLINRIKLGKLLNKLEHAPFLPKVERGGNNEEKLIKAWIAFNIKQRVMLYVTAMAAISFGIGYSLIQRIRYSDPQKWIFNYGPLTILNVTYSPNYEISWVYQNVSFVFIAIIVCSSTIILSGILAFVSVQFQLLQNSLRNPVGYSHQQVLQNDDAYGISATGNNEAPQWKHLKSALKETVLYHVKILELISEFGEIFSMSMFATYLGILCALCFIMYSITSSPLDSLNDIETLKQIGEAGSLCILALLLCYWGEQVAEDSEKVGIAAYEANFVGSDLRFQRGLVIIMRRSQRPTRIKAGYFIETSLVTFAWILRASYSCFMVLRNTKQE